MAQQTIDITPVTGDSGQSGGTKINDNFAELYTAVGLKANASNAALTGTPTSATTPAQGDNSTKIPNTAWVINEISANLAGLKWKEPVFVATTANITLSGEQTIDGVLTAATRVLVKNQSAAANNGIYLSSSGSWSRTSDANAAAELEGAVVTVQGGTANANTTWNQTTDNITLGSSAITWGQFGTSVPNADASTAGIAKLYPSTSLGTSTDGAPTQNAAKAYADAKVADALVDGTTTVAPSQNVVFDALALKVNLTDFVTLTDGSTVSWNQQNEQTPLAKVTMAAATRTLTITNAKSGASGAIKIITNTASAITITFTSSTYTHKVQNATFTTYTLPSGTGLEYYLSFIVDGTTIEWVIGVRAPLAIQNACSDLVTPLTAGAVKGYFRMPYAMTVTAVRASLRTAQTGNGGGGIFTVDINKGGTTILSTKLTIDNTEKTSVTAAAAAVISDASLADDAEITVDIDQVGDGTAVGLVVTLIGYSL